VVDGSLPASGKLHYALVDSPLLSGPNLREGDTAALREMHEGIGIAPEDVEIVGRLGDFISATNSCIAPFVGVVPWPYPLRIAPCEVARTFTIPLDWLSGPANHELHEHTLLNTTVTVVRYRYYSGELLWGATARMTVSLVQILAAGNNFQQQRLATR
jgi:hypothetical protein